MYRRKSDKQTRSDFRLFENDWFQYNMACILLVIFLPVTLEWTSRKLFFFFVTSSLQHNCFLWNIPEFENKAKKQRNAVGHIDKRFNWALFEFHTFLLLNTSRYKTRFLLGALCLEKGFELFVCVVCCWFYHITSKAGLFWLD